MIMSLCSYAAFSCCVYMCVHIAVERYNQNFNWLIFVLQVLWSFIVGMLTNLESLPLERIHSMLKMFAMQGPNSAECGIQELKAFLDSKVKEQKLLCVAGVYRLPKPGT